LKNWNQHGAPPRAQFSAQSYGKRHQHQAKDQKIYPLCKPRRVNSRPLIVSRTAS
jgi:hypothetical protein